MAAILLYPDRESTTQNIDAGARSWMVNQSSSERHTSTVMSPAARCIGFRENVRNQPFSDNPCSTGVPPKPQWRDVITMAAY